VSGYIHTHVAVGASAAAGTFAPAADSEIQPYNKREVGLLLGHHAGITALAGTASGHTTYDVQIVQEPAYIFGDAVDADHAARPIVSQLDGVVATGMGNDETPFSPAGKLLPRDADMVAYANGPGSDAAVILSHVLYGTPLFADQVIGKRFYHLLEDALDCSGTAEEEFEDSPISNFDPKKLYALLGGGGLNEGTDIGHYITCSAPSFGGVKPKFLFADGHKLTRVYDPVSMRQMVFAVFSGAESLTVTFTGCATQKPGAILELVEIGNVDALSQEGNTETGVLAPDMSGGGFGSQGFIQGGSNVGEMNAFPGMV